MKYEILPWLILFLPLLAADESHAGAEAPPRGARPGGRGAAGVRRGRGRRAPPGVTVVDDVRGAGVERGEHQLLLVDRPGHDLVPVDAVLAVADRFAVYETRHGRRVPGTIERGLPPFVR